MCEVHVLMYICCDATEQFNVSDAIRAHWDACSLIVMSNIHTMTVYMVRVRREFDLRETSKCLIAGEHRAWVFICRSPHRDLISLSLPLVLM